MTITTPIIRIGLYVPRKKRARPMTNRPPKRDPRAATAAPVPPVEPADYSDELTSEQLAVLRRLAPQAESEMGDLVHEFKW